MSQEKIMNFIQEHWYFVMLSIGILVLVGSIFNWNWICNPVGKSYSQHYGRGLRRVIFFLLGVVLIIVSLWNV